MQDNHRFFFGGPWLVLLGLFLLGVMTALLGSAVHLARMDVLGLLVPHGLLLAIALIVATDVAVGSMRPRGGAGRALLVVGLGRGMTIGLLLLPRTDGDVVLTGLPASTVWILLAVLLPAFAAPVVTALSNARALTQRTTANPWR